MATVVQSIILSSGTIIKIPIFPYRDSTHQSSLSKYTRAIPIIRAYSGSVITTTLSDADILELGNILYGRNQSSFTSVTPSVGGQYISTLYWFYNTRYEEWCLSLDFQLNISGSWEVTAQNFRPESEFPRRYFNNENPNADSSVRSWFDALDYYNNAWYPIQLYNVRSGIPYSLDIATNSEINTHFSEIKLSVLSANITRFIELNPDSDITIIGYDPESNDDPFIVDDPSSLGGGGGAREDPDEIEKAEIPPLPSLSAVDTGLITMYGATLAQLQSLGAYLWSDLWDIENNFKKLFADPMNCLIGLSIVPVTPSMGAAANVKFGNITTNIALNKLTSQYAEVDCGTLNIKEYIGSFLDYSPYVNISLYLPYIGYRELSPDDVMNESIHVVYHLDVLTGGCCAFVECGKKGLLYTFNGSAIANVPITAINYSGAIQNAVSAVGAMATTAVGMATGAAPIAAMGAANLMGAAAGAANTAMNSKPSVQRSGNMGGSAGIMSYQKPLLVITRPRMSVPDKLNKFVGLTTNVTMNLSQVKGFTQVDLIHLNNVPCTDKERDELLTLLKQGVIL